MRTVYSIPWMSKLLSAALVVLTLVLTAGAASVSAPADAVAQDRSRELSQSLSRLQNNPRYRGRILGTHIRETDRGFLYEVRILRRDDRVILVYIDPRTGGVVGDSERSGRPPTRRSFDDRDRRPPPARAPDRRRQRR